LIEETTTFDRIACYTNSTFSGTGTVRLGIYDNGTGGKPTTVVLDAGTVSCTAASTLYTITINQQLSAGWYWLAFNMQTAATTSSFIAHNIGVSTPLQQKTANFGLVVQYLQSSVTGTFATAGTLTAVTNVGGCCSVELRAA
jgi:hypothetical protein